MKLLLASLVASALCWAIAVAEPIDRIARQVATTTTAVSTAPCTTTKVRKKITWNFYLPPIHAMPRYVQFYDLISDGSGYAWREANGGDTDDHVTRRIMFENDQGWTLINCTWKFPAGDPDRGACTSPDFGLLNTPGTNVGDAPPNKGKIGTLDALTFPALSLWAVYDLLEFCLTPVATGKFLNEQLMVDILGWREDGSSIDAVHLKVKGSEVGHKVSLPKEWTKVVQWQVKVWWSNGSAATRQDFQFVIDDVIINEYAVGFTDTDTHCLYPTQTPSSTPSSATLKFDDIAASPTGTIPAVYKSYAFSPDWTVTKAQSYPNNSPGSRSATSKPNSLYSVNLPWTINDFHGPDFLFDIDTFHITIDNKNTTTQNPADLTVSVQSYNGCHSQGDGGAPDAGGSFTVNPTSYGFNVDLKAVGFRKVRGVVFSVYDNVGAHGVPFWIDDVVVGSWKGVLSLPGCERCGGGTLTQPWGLRDFCEYPIQKR